MDDNNSETCATISEDENLLNDKNIFVQKLREWAIRGNIELTQLSKLLKILVNDGHHNELPTDARTLLQTPRKVNVVQLNNGYYVHMGINFFLNTYFEKKELEILELNLEKIELSFNVDGTPISTSGGSDFWPILGSVSNFIGSQPEVFLVGIFNGPSKPESYNNYLRYFVDEMKDLMTNGYQWKTRRYEIIMKAFICDAPALAFVKAIKCHGGYHCCSKCYIKGTIHFTGIKGQSKVVYTDLEAPLRTDALFRTQKTFSGDDDVGHHMNKERSVLEQLPIDMIKTFPIDKMHLVDEGVVKKIIKLWIGKPGPYKLPSIKVSIINDRLKKCYPYMPNDFQRKPRTLKYANFLKASECRVFLLYTGPAVLRKVLPKSYYNHFMCLSLATRILTSHIYYRIYNSYAKTLLVYFVKYFPALYGSQNVTYNVHGLLHIAEDAYELGPLDSNSCYLYEAYIKKIKKMLHSLNRPLQQCSNRVYEMTKLNLSIDTIKSNNEKQQQTYPIFSHNIYGTNKFKTASFSNFTIRANTTGDCCIMLDNQTVLRVSHFEVRSNDQKVILGQKLVNEKCPIDQPENFYKFFCMVGNFDNSVREYLIDDKTIICKMCCLPNDCEEIYKYFVIPINHTLTTFN